MRYYDIYNEISGKILEKIIRNAIVDHMTSNNLFSKAQLGFMAGRSCVTQLLEFMKDITEAIDSGKEADVIYLDFCKAFYKDPHKRLLMKMQKYGIKGNILNWVKVFLSERHQRVIVNGSASSWEDITSGIPKGECPRTYSRWGLKATAVPCLPCRARSGVPVI